ncbi:hypothetical protein ACFP2T_34330 [Plantactinospora solaniradicis]|uniref:Uncharacterized protein n=1 Tax=Plantactinospora solaniradicis TaxID=1723736 RepID=A0ABW1KI69_9ACTN
MLSAVHDQPHTNAGSIIGVVREARGGVARQFVHDLLHALAAACVVRFEPMNSVARCEARGGDNHHHLVCRYRSALADVGGPVGHTACRCPTCVTATSAVPDG